MGNIRYVPFEPGIGAQRTMAPKTMIVRGVAQVPPVEAVQSGECLEWFAEPETANLLHLQTLAPASPPTRVAVMRDAERLFAAFHCAEPQMHKAHRLVPRGAKDGAVEVFLGMSRTLIYDECVGLYLDADHGKSAYLLMQTNINGARLASAVESAMGWTAFPSNAASASGADLEGLDWESEVCEADGHWRAAFSVRLAGLAAGARSRPTVGLNFARWRNVDVWRQYSWAPAPHLDHFPALAMGDGYFSRDPVRVTRIDWGILDYGENRARVTLQGNRRGGEAVLQVGVQDAERCEETGRFAQTRSRPAAVPKGGEAELAADFFLPHDYYNVLVTLEVATPDGAETFYRATFPLGNHAGVRIQPYERAVRREGDAAPENPLPSDPDFHRKKREFVLSKLPRFRRRNTADGAPSDFVLSAADGSVEFDLMKPGALRRIADWLCTLFESDCDRIVALALLTNDDWVTTHAAPRVGMHKHLTPLSQLRLGCGHCYSRAEAAAGIAAQLPDPATGGRHRANATLVVGHVVVAVERGDGYVLFDPSFGHFFFNADNTDLATARELAADPSLVARAVKQPKKRFCNYAQIPTQIRLEPGTVVWPAGAPPE